MAFTPSTLSLRNQLIGGKRRVWDYLTTDSLATVLGAGYLTGCAGKYIKTGDIISVQKTDDTPPTNYTLSVDSITSDAATLKAQSVTMTDLTLTGNTKLGDAVTDTIGAYGVPPVVQPAGATQAAITDSSGGTANATTGVAANAFKQTIAIPVQLSDLVNAGVWKVALPFAATVLSALFRTGKPASTAAKAATLTVTTNGGGAVTGGVMSLTSANQNATGGSAAASAISGAGATIAAGQTVEVTVSGVTAFVEGDGWVEFTVSNNDLANAEATTLALLGALRTALLNVGWIKGAA